MGKAQDIVAQKRQDIIRRLDGGQDLPQIIEGLGVDEAMTSKFKTALNRDRQVRAKMRSVTLGLSLDEASERLGVGKKLLRRWDLLGMHVYGPHTISPQDREVLSHMARADASDGSGMPSTREVVDALGPGYGSESARENIIARSKARLRPVLAEVVRKTWGEMTHVPSHKMWADAAEQGWNPQDMSQMTSARLLKARLEKMGGEHEGEWVRATQMAVGRLLKDQSICTDDFALRLHRLHMWGIEAAVFDSKQKTPTGLEQLRQKIGKKGSDTLTFDDLQGIDRPLANLLDKKMKGSGWDGPAKVGFAAWLIAGVTDSDRYRRNAENDDHVLAALRKMIDTAGGNPSDVTVASNKADVLFLHYRYHGKGNAGAGYPAIIKGLREFAPQLGIESDIEEIELKLRLKANPELKKTVMLKTYDPQTPVESYLKLFGLQLTGHMKNVTNLEADLTRAIDASEDVCTVARRYDVGARGMARVLETLSHAPLTRAGNRRLFKERSPKPSNTDAEPKVREDMLTLAEVGERISEESAVIRGYGRNGRRLPNVMQSDKVSRLAQPLEELIAATQKSEKDQGRVRQLSTQAMELIEEMEDTPLEQRYVESGLKDKKTKRMITDANLDKVKKWLTHSMQEAEMHMQSQ